MRIHLLRIFLVLVLLLVLLEVVLLLLVLLEKEGHPMRVGIKMGRAKHHSLRSGISVREGTRLILKTIMSRLGWVVVHRHLMKVEEVEDVV